MKVWFVELTQWSFIDLRMFCWFNVDQSYGRSFKTGLPKKKHTHIAPCIYSPWKLPYQLKLDGLVPLFRGRIFVHLWGMFYCCNFCIQQKRDVFPGKAPLTAAAKGTSTLIVPQSNQGDELTDCSVAQVTWRTKTQGPQHHQNHEFTPHTTTMAKKKSRFFFT